MRASFLPEIYLSIYLSPPCQKRASNLIDLEPKFVAVDEAEEEAAAEETATGR
jgi:hypothetical protein